MGYLNNTTRTLDAILTKKGRELLSTGGNFTVSKFALGDDEIDYDLWDTTHTRGTDYYGAVIENLPALEPFNDPSEIMKYKLVSRSDGTRAMAKLVETNNTSTQLSGTNSALVWETTENDFNRASVVGEPTLEKFGAPGVAISIQHKDNSNYGAVDQNLYSGESYTITLLDSSIALLAPDYQTVKEGVMVEKSNNTSLDSLWLPFVNNVQHISQTISGTVIGSGGNLRKSGLAAPIMIYPKRISQQTKTSIVITGESSGAVIEFDVTVRKS
ncbi:hypothetical protein HOE22_05235 [Candidatus Woesearchaeota archaeon]|jgi:hypothetical protein|nr:hypothetical protein [Candidatus Woesearchaeota archaeon]MBT4731141.1 hypothetical protein [Candidatus Woesearchaeota archaeon]